MYNRPIFLKIVDRLKGTRTFIQVLAGPRQTGKTTLARQAMDAIGIPAHYASADEPALKDRIWIEQQWEAGRLRCREEGAPALLVLDEIQKISGWSETVKRLWDEDSASNRPLRVLLLGSSPLLVKAGLSESLAGRFEIVPVTHWSFAEMRDAFGYTLEQYLIFGGYPGAAALIGDPPRWKRYILDSLVETTISRDIMLMHRVHKPELLRRLFELGCHYSGQVLSYQKMLGQLQDAGNTTTLAHYLDLLEQSGLICGVPKYAGQQFRRRASSPKLLALNTALMTVSLSGQPESARERPEHWGRLVETAVGGFLSNASREEEMGVYYWRERNREVDYVLESGGRIAAIEVKSAPRRDFPSGLAEFCRQFEVRRKILVGSQGIPLDEFLLTPPRTWVE